MFMAFKMRSGNKVSFKNMGSSPAKDMKTGSYEHSFESPAKQSEYQLEKKAQMQNASDRIDLEDKQYEAGVRQGKRDRKNRINAITGTPLFEKGKEYNLTPKKYGPKKPPTKQRLNKGGEGQDQDKIFNSKGEHVGDYVNDKVVMKPGFKRPVVKKDTPVKPKEGDMEKYSDLEKYDDDRSVSTSKQKTPKDGDYEKYSDLEKYDDDNPTGKAKPPTKQVKTKGLGPRKAFGGVKNPELVKVKKSTVSKHGQLDDAEIEYQNDLKLLKEMAENKKKK